MFTLNMLPKRFIDLTKEPCPAETERQREIIEAIKEAQTQTIN